MRINHNLAALNTHRQLTNNTLGTNKSLEKLSSGFRINRAGDDAAGLAISEKMRGQIRGLEQASRNAQDAISLIQTAEGAMSTTHNILQRMRELAVQAANDTSTDSDRTQLQKEIEQLKSEIDRIAYTTEFNTKKLLNGSLTATKALQGTKTNSAVFDAADIAASAGKMIGGTAVSERGSVQTITGQGYSVTGFNAIDEYTKVIAGVNDKFFFTVSGLGTGTGTLSGKISVSAGQGYTRAEFAQAIEDAINAALSGANLKVEGNQVDVSVSNDNKLVFTTRNASVLAKVTIEDPTATSGSALASMGFDGYQNKIEGTLDVSNGVTFASGGHSAFAITVGGKQVTIDGLSGFYSKTSLINAINDQLDAEFGAGVIKVEDSDSDGKLEIVSSIKVDNFVLSGGSGLNTIFGLSAATSGGLINTGSIVEVAGKNTQIGYANGINIAAGVNDQFRISVDGSAAETITLSAKLYASKQDLVNEINNQIGSNTNLTGKVQASLDADNKIVFTSVSTGSSSSVVISDPLSVDQSALGALGYGPRAGNIEGNVNIARGFDIGGTGNATNRFQLNVTLGNKTATLNLLDQPNVFLATTANSGNISRDAIVKALQAELDEAFGVNAVNVSTIVSGSGERLRFTTITDTAKFTISAPTSVEASGAFAMLVDGFSGGNGTNILTAALGTTPTNVTIGGTDAIDNTLATSTLLKDLVDHDSNNLGLSAGNVITIRGTQNGEEFSTTFTVQDDSTIGDLLGALRSLDAFAGASVALNLADGKIEVTGRAGEKYDISNLRFEAQKSATDKTAVGNFNRTFGSFEVTQKAQDAASDSSLIMQIGANQGQTVNVDINNVSAESLKVHAINVTTKDGAQAAITIINNALDVVSEERAKLGAIQNRLEHTINNLGTSAENLTASESRIRDVDMAKEMMEFTKNNILSQAAQAMLAQANQQPQGVLQLLR